jgi:hypothetical protein
MTDLNYFHALYLIYSCFFASITSSKDFPKRPISLSLGTNRLRLYRTCYTPCRLSLNI